MQYFLNDTAIGPYSGKVFGKKGDVVSIISEHGNMAIVESGSERFPVKMEKLSKKEVLQDPAQLILSEPEYKPAFSKAKGNKKPVSNQSNNIQSLF